MDKDPTDSGLKLRDIGDSMPNGIVVVDAARLRSQG
jgi:hypothetical protein